MNTSITTTEEYLATLPQWQQTNLTLFRSAIHDTLPDGTEAIKWGVPTFISGKKIVFAMSAFKAHTKFNFILNGALLKDDNGTFNNGLESKTARAIDVREGESINEAALRDLVNQSVALLAN